MTEKIVTFANKNLSSIWVMLLFFLIDVPLVSKRNQVYIWIFLLTLMGCNPAKPAKIPLDLLEKIDLDTLTADLRFPKVVDSISQKVQASILANNSHDHLVNLEINLLFNPNGLPSEEPNKYYQTHWKRGEYKLILVSLPAGFTYFVLLSEYGIVHDVLAVTHYMPGPLCCDYDRRELIRFDNWDLEFEEIFSYVIEGTDSCGKVTNNDIYQINQMNYFEHMSRKTLKERKKRYGNDSQCD